MRNNIRELLYASFDRKLEETERELLDSALETSEDLRTEHREISRLRDNAAGASGSSFSPLFVENVMERVRIIHREAPGPLDFFAALKSAFNRVAVGAALACLVLVFLNLTGGGLETETEVVSGPEETFEDMYEQLSYQILEESL